MDFLGIWGDLARDPSLEGKSEVPSQGKSEEELSKFTVDERLSEVERTVLYLNGGQQIQQRHAIRNLPVVIRGRGRPAWDAINPALKSALNKLDAEAQIDAAEAFAALVRDRLMGPSELQACLLPTICRNINKEKSEEEIEAWLQALFVLIPLLDKEVLRTEVASLALSKGDVEESITSRVICVRILGAISTWMTRDEVERSFFKKAMLMCQDVHYYVRVAMCQQLNAIGRAVGPELVANEMLEEMLELLKDEEVKVRAAAFSALVALMELLPPDVRKARVMPVLRDHMQPFDLDPAMQICVTQHFGTLLNLVKGDMEANDHALFYGCFRHLAARSDVELRQAAAHQLPIVIKAAAAVSPGSYQSQFHDTLLQLSGDAAEGVRAAMAEKLHECARLVGKDSGPLLVRPLARLLRDESAKVQTATLARLGVTLQGLVAGVSEQGPPKRETLMADVVKALVEVEAATGGGARRWRTQAAIAGAFTSFPQAFSSDQIYEHFIPMAFRLLSTSAAALRQPAAEGLAQLLRYGRKEKQRADTFLRLVREFARAKSFNLRIVFGHVAQHLLSAFSSKFVKEWVFDLCLELLYDPVPNVRLQFVPLLPALKQVIRLPEDVDLLERLNNAMSHAMTDNDRDVSVTSRSVNDAFKRLPVRMGMGSQVVEVNGMMGGGFEALDRKREEEEAELPSFTPEDAKEIKAEILAYGMRRRGPNTSISGEGLGGAGGRMPRKSGAGQPSGGPATVTTARQTSGSVGTSSSASTGPAAKGNRMPSPSQRAGAAAAAAAAVPARAGAAAVSAAVPARGGAAAASSSIAAPTRTSAVSAPLPSKLPQGGRSGGLSTPAKPPNSSSGSFRTPSPTSTRPAPAAVASSSSFARPGGAAAQQRSSASTVTTAKKPVLR